MLAPLLLLATPAAAATGTYVRFAQLAADMPGTELVVSSLADPDRSLTIGGGLPGQISEYRRVEPGDYVLAVRPTGATDTVLVQAALRADVRSSYTVLAGLESGPALRVVTDDLTPAAAGAARVRVVDARPGGGPLDLRDAAGTTVAVPAGDGPVGPYTSVAAGALAVLPPGAPALDAGVLAPGSVVSLFVLPEGDGARVVPVVDARGVEETPPGPVHAGYGGLAGPPGQLAAGGPGPDPLTPAALLLVGAGALVVWVRSGRPAAPGRG